MRRILRIVAMFSASGGAASIPALRVSTRGASCSDDTTAPAGDVALL